MLIDFVCQTIDDVAIVDMPGCIIFEGNETLGRRGERITRLDTTAGWVETYVTDPLGNAIAQPDGRGFRRRQRQTKGRLLVIWSRPPERVKDEIPF